MEYSGEVRRGVEWRGEERRGEEWKGEGRATDGIALRLPPIIAGDL